MKKTILCILLICVLVISGFSASASEVDSEENTQEPMTILEWLQQNRKENEDLIYSVEFHENMDDVDLSCPILRLYTGIPNLLMDGRSPEAMIAEMDENPDIYRLNFILFADSYKALTFNYTLDMIGESPMGYHTKHFLEELRTGTMQQTFLGEECVITDIYVVYRDLWGAFIIYKTDKGDFVRFYSNKPPVEFTWEEFSEYAYEDYAREMERVKEQMPAGAVGLSWNL